MLIIKKREKSEPAKFTHTFRGQEISLTVRPYDQAEIQEIIKKHTIFIVAVHPETKKLDRIAVTDDNAVGEDVVDRLLMDFTGFGSAPSEPLPVTRENKILIASLKEKVAGKEPVYFSQVIQEKAQELAEIFEVEEKALTKN
jgi:hypothetical protein